jgi:hypothetical protein
MFTYIEALCTLNKQRTIQQTYSITDELKSNTN